MKRAVVLALLAFAAAPAAQAQVPAGKFEVVYDPNPLTVNRALAVADRVGYRTFGEWRRANGRTVHIRVFTTQRVYMQDGTWVRGVLQSTLTVKLVRDGRLSLWDSMFSSRPRYVAGTNRNDGR